MLKKSIARLSGSIFGSAMLAAIVSLLIIMTFGGIGAQNVSTPAASSSGSVSSSSSQSSSSSESSSSESVASSASSSSQITATSSVNKKSMYSVGGIIDTTAGKLFLGISGILITFALIYSTGWREGNKDPNKIKYGHMKKFMAKGFVAGAFSTIPYIIYTTVFLLVNAYAKGSMTSMTIGAIYRALNMQYIVFSDTWLNYPAVCYSLLLIYPIAAGIGYIMGFRGIVLISRLVYKKKPASKYMKNLKR